VQLRQLLIDVAGSRPPFPRDHIPDAAYDLYDWYRRALWAQVVVNAVAGAWALAAHRWTRIRNLGLWIVTAAGYLVASAALVMAAILIRNYEWSAPRDLMLYEFSALIAAGVIYSYAHQLKARRYLIYGFGSLFIMGLAVRALVMLNGFR
jgi:hypothetical protein